MSVTLPASFPAVDPERIRPFVDVVADPEFKDSIEGQNWCFAKLRQAPGFREFLKANQGDGLYQGTSSPIDTTADGSTYTLRATMLYRARGSYASNNELKFVTRVQTNGGTVRVRANIQTTSFGAVDTIVNAHTASGISHKEGTAAGGALSPNTTYIVEIEIQAPTSGWGKLLQFSLIEDDVAQGDLPTT